MSGLETRLENKINELENTKIAELKMKLDKFELYKQNQSCMIQIIVKF
jgi:hypothetical protein